MPGERPVGRNAELERLDAFLAAVRADVRSLAITGPAGIGKTAVWQEGARRAAERGFVGRRYKKVYTDYQTVAEESLAKDEIPPGYRFYVRRYFQLIRPRD